MSGPDPAGCLLLLAALVLVLQMARLGLRWRIGRPANVDWVRGFAGLPHAYFHTVHAVVARQKRIARMHVLAAGGLLAAAILSLPLHLAGLGGRWLAALVLLAVLATLAGAGLDVGRRRPKRPAHLSPGRFARFPFAIALVAIFLLLAALPPLAAVRPAPFLWAVIDLIGALGLGWLLAGAWRGPLRHALAGVVHLIAHPRPGRPAGVTTDTALVLLDLQNEPLGADGPADFAWNRLVGFDACVQCGRCETVCPAFAAGQPLNPKRLIQDLVAATGPGAAFYEGSPHPGLSPAAETHPVAADTLWACTTCRACVEECPMLIEHVDAVIDLRRHAALETGEMPEKSADALIALRETSTVIGRALSSRLDWAVEFALPRLMPETACDVLLWIGEGGFDPRHQRSLRALCRLLRAADVDFAVLEEEPDCGDLARRLGDEATFQAAARATVATLAGLRFRRIVTADPHALHCLAREYPALGGVWEVAHHSSLLLSLVEAGALRLEPTEARRVTYHDPCYLGRYMGEFDAPRELLRRAGISVVEMARARSRSSCCGGGGGAALADVPGRRRIPEVRMDHARETGAGVVAVACPGCMQMLEGVTGERPEVLDLAELLLPALVCAS
jgi:dimethylglycine catabolism B